MRCPPGPTCGDQPAPTPAMADAISRDRAALADAVLGLEDFVTIQALVKRGVYLCDIAEQLGVHPRTVRRALRRGGPPAPRRGRRASRLDPYRAQVDQLLSEGVWNAVVLLRELQAKGY